MRKIVGLNLFLGFLFLFLLFDNSAVKGVDYKEVCKQTITAGVGEYRQCHDNYIYLIDDKDKSSHITSTLKLNTDEQILYVGKIDGIDTFYTLSFQFFGVIYDERALSKSDMNYWADISFNGVVVYDGAFEDTWLIDQSEIQRVTLYDEQGTYLIRHFIGGKMTNKIKVIIPSKTDYSVDIAVAKYGEKNLYSNNLIGKTDNLVFDVVGGLYGFSKKVDVSVNACEFVVRFNKKLVIDNSEFSSCLKYNDINNVMIVIYNGFNKGVKFKYSFNLNSNNVSIKLEDSISAVETSSRRVLIHAYAGNGKNLKEEYSLYYWSENADDKLTYKDFMSNYENSQYKGVYSISRGVILRDAVGTYYLYALAVDDDSNVVVRSEEYVLKKKERLNKIMTKDIIYVGGLIVLAVAPIVIYLLVRGKDTD